MPTIRLILLSLIYIYIIYVFTKNEIKAIDDIFKEDENNEHPLLTVILACFIFIIYSIGLGLFSSLTYLALNSLYPLIFTL